MRARYEKRVVNGKFKNEASRQWFARNPYTWMAESEDDDDDFMPPSIHGGKNGGSSGGGKKGGSVDGGKNGREHRWEGKKYGIE